MLCLFFDMSATNDLLRFVSHSSPFEIRWLWIFFHVDILVYRRFVFLFKYSTDVNILNIALLRIRIERRIDVFKSWCRCWLLSKFSKLNFNDASPISRESLSTEKTLRINMRTNLNRICSQLLRKFNIHIEDKLLKSLVDADIRDVL